VLAPLQDQATVLHPGDHRLPGLEPEVLPSQVRGDYHPPLGPMISVALRRVRAMSAYYARWRGDGGRVAKASDEAVFMTLAE